MISRRHLIRSVGGLSALGISTAAYGVGVEPELRPRITRYHPAPRQWPTDFPLKIAVIADIHACDPWMSLQRIEAIVDQANSLKPDLVVLLGDYVAGHHYVTRLIPAAEWARVLTGLRAPLGIHAVMGNHDYWDDKIVQRAGHGTTVAHRALDAAGIPVYENDAVRLTKDGRSFWLAGLGDQLAYVVAPRYGHPRAFGADDLTAMLSRITDDAPVILLAHEPNIAWRVPARVALQLSGHTHGGQVRLLGWSPAIRGPNGGQLAYGHVRLKCDVIISGGLGCSLMPVRVGVPPEIVEVTLGRAPAPVVA